MRHSQAFLSVTLISFYAIYSGGFYMSTHLYYTTLQWQVQFLRRLLHVVVHVGTVAYLDWIKSSFQILLMWAVLNKQQ